MILITGAAGFIGYHLFTVLKDNATLVLIDNLTPFSNGEIKRQRWGEMKRNNSANHLFLEEDLAQLDSLERVFQNNNIESVIHLAAITGVRKSKDHREVYRLNNVEGFRNVLTCCNKYKTKHLIYASSSSVYGADSEAPFIENEACESQQSYYAETKKINESDATAFAKHSTTSIVGLRFFTVYGPWGRPDMATYKFVDAIYHGRMLTIFGEGKMQRDFTYVLDVVRAIIEILKIQIEGKVFKNEIFNVGFGAPLSVLEYVELLEKTINTKAALHFDNNNTEEMEITWANISKIHAEIGEYEQISRREGLQHTFQWYLKYIGDLK